ncbi:MAG: diacylglycerol/lipid kinase family protein [Alphaproteobacteria bacterium]
MKPGAVLNVGSGTLRHSDLDTLTRSMTDAFERQGVELPVAHTDGPNLLPTIQSMMQHRDPILVGGGDGSIAAAAAGLCGTGHCLGILPFGTMNLVARDLNLPPWTEDIVPKLVRGHVREIDVASVNGEVFLHSVVLGTFPQLSQTREELRDATTPWRWPTFLQAVTRELLAGETVEYRVETRKKGLTVPTRSLMICNNKIVDAPKFGLSRARLDRGRLYVYLPRDETPLETAGTLARFLTGLWNGNPRLRRIKTKRARIGAEQPEILASVDGEVRAFTSPLDFNIERRALKVWVPAP